MVRSCLELPEEQDSCKHILGITGITISSTICLFFFCSEVILSAINVFVKCPSVLGSEMKTVCQDHGKQTRDIASS